MTSSANVDLVTVRRAITADAGALAAFASEAFRDTFGADNTDSDMTAYLASAFGESIQHGEIADPANTVLLAERAGELVGYVHLRDGDVPLLVRETPALEIARLYAGRQWIGAGIGALLMTHALREAAARGKRSVWLGVWERNARALAFYARWGFTDAGAQSFQLGADVQTDRVMVRRVEG